MHPLISCAKMDKYLETKTEDEYIDNSLKEYKLYNEKNKLHWMLRRKK